ncbi:MAG TPA: thioredoxin domain-containing protein [Blastocatellia bacterium]|nr:thioredoxin domain-containing protein [Blastocatellia bacterium]
MKRVSLLMAVGAMIASLAQPGKAFLNVSQDRSAAPVAKQSAAATPSKSAEKKAEDCGCEVKPPPDVLAIVNGVKIAIKDVEEPLQERIRALQDQVIEARKRQLELEINSSLLDAEARRLGITTEKLLDREVTQKSKEPTEAEARSFYDLNKSQIQGEFKDVKDQVIGYLRGLRQREIAKRYADRLRTGARVKVLVPSATPPETDADRARVFAIVNAKRITSGDVEDSLKAIVASVQEQIYSLRKDELDAKINNTLLDQEAQKKGVTAPALYQTEIAPRMKPVTDEEARKFYDENKSRMTGTFEQRQAQIIEYLQNSRRTAAEKAFAEDLRKGATLQVFLKPPDPPVFNIPIDDRPWRGGASAPVTIVEFTDYECPSCGATQPVLEEIVKEFGDKVKLVARNYPLDQHKHAFKAAEAAESAREQGKYWEYVAILFKNQNALEVEKLKEYADQLGLDRGRFDAALDSGKFADKVRRDLSEGDKVGVDSTPTVFINGRRARDRSREALKAAIEAALKEGVKK